MYFVNVPHFHHFYYLKLGFAEIFMDIAYSILLVVNPKTGYDK